LEPRYSPCGFQSFCGRPDHHRGHHGGWRTGVQIIVPKEQRVPVYEGSNYLVGDEVPPRALQIVGEYLSHGCFKEVADCLNISLQTVKNHASTAIATTGATSTANVAYRLGWVHLPSGIAHPRKFDECMGSGI